MDLSMAIRTKLRDHCHTEVAHIINTLGAEVVKMDIEEGEIRE